MDDSPQHPVAAGPDLTEGRLGRGSPSAPGLVELTEEVRNPGAIQHRASPAGPCKKATAKKQQGQANPETGRQLLGAASGDGSSFGVSCV